jgi:hypothetical protein
MLKQNIDEWLFVSKAGKQCQISVYSFAWLAPTLQSKSAYEAKLPALRLADTLKLGGGEEDLNHGVLPF